MADGQTSEANLDGFSHEAQLFRRELRRTVERSGFKQWSADESDKRALTNLIGVGRTKLTAALDISKTTLPDPYLVRQLARHCDPDSSYLTDYRDWVEQWIQAPTEEDKAALPARPSRNCSASGSGGAGPATALGAPLQTTEVKSVRPAPADVAGLEADPVSLSRRPLMWGFGALLAGVMLVVGTGSAAGWWKGGPDAAGGPSAGTAPSQASASSTTGQVAESVAQPPPTGAGPWPYRVVNTGTLGLFIRTGPLQTDVRLPGNPVAFDDTTLLAACQTTSDFDPDPDTGAAGRWLNVHWPEAASPPGSYVYAGYTEPIGHSGDIPVCP